MFADNFYKVFTSEPLTGNLKVNTPPCSESLKTTDVFENIILRKLNKLKDGKCHGPDSIRVTLFKRCAHFFAKPLSILFSRSFNSGFIRLDAFVRSVYKKGDQFDQGIIV